MFKKYLPSKKIIGIFLVPIIFLFLYIIILSYLDKKTYDGTETKLVSNINKKIDTDADGLEDWEENLIGTDKTKSDTDGDGLSDILEVRTGSDPLDPLNKEKKKNDIIKKLESGNFNYDYRLDEKLNNTDRLSLQFLEESVKLKKAGLSFNKDAKEQVVNKILSQNTVSINLNKFSLKDLRLRDVEDFKFKEDILDVSSDLKKEGLVSEIYLLNKYMDKRDKKYLEEIKMNTDIYKKYLNKFIKISVPKNKGNDYLKFINAFNSEIEAISYYASVKNDPVSLVQVMSIYKELDNNLIKSTTALFK